VTDPYRPAPPAFPRARLQRAGLDEDTVTRAEAEFADLDEQGRAGFSSWVVANSDDAIRGRYAQSSPAEVADEATPDAGQQDAPAAEAPGEAGQPEQPAAESQPAQPVEQPAAEQSASEPAAPAEQQAPQQAPQEPAEEPATGPTYEELNALTIDQLDARIGEWNTAHPDGPHLIVSGRKGEKIGRLLDAYDGEREAATQAPADAAPEQPAEPAATEQQVPVAPTATTPDGAPAAEAPAAAGFVPPPGTVEPPAGAQEPAQTADAAPGADAAPTEE
jgi:hypothetical protein